MTVSNLDLRSMLDNLWASGPQIKEMATEPIARTIAWLKARQHDKG